MLINAPKSMFNIFFILILCGGLIFFLANTPSENLTRIVDAFANGDISGSLNAIVDACMAFATNVKDKFNPRELSETISTSLCKIMSHVGYRDCR